MEELPSKSNSKTLATENTQEVASTAHVAAKPILASVSSVGTSLPEADSPITLLSKPKALPTRSVKKPVTNPLVTTTRRTSGPALTMTYDSTETGKLRKRTHPETTPSAHVFKNLSHQNNVYKKQRLQADAMPCASQAQLKQLGLRSSQSSINAVHTDDVGMSAPASGIQHLQHQIDVPATNNVPIKIDTIIQAKSNVPAQGISPASMSPNTSYQQHDKPPRYIPLSCPFWVASEDCPKNTGCFFQHQTMDRCASYDLFHQAIVESTRKGKFSLKFGFFDKLEVCSHWARGFCKNPDEVCWHAHWMPKSGITEMPAFLRRPKRNKTCAFWAEGGCNKTEEECSFMHSYTNEIAFKPGSRLSGIVSLNPNPIVGTRVASDQYTNYISPGASPMTYMSPDAGKSPLSVQNGFTTSSVHPDRQVMLSMQNGSVLPQSSHLSTMSQPNILPSGSSRPVQGSITMNLTLRLLVDDVTTTWTLSQHLGQIVKQAGSICDMAQAISISSLAGSVPFADDFAQGCFSALTGDASSLSRFRDLASWMRAYSKAIWHPLQNSRSGILVLTREQMDTDEGGVSSEQTEWSAKLPRIEINGDGELVYILLKQESVNAIVENTAQTLATMDAEFEQITNHVKLPSSTGDFSEFFNWFGGKTLAKQVFLGHNTSPRIARIMRMYFEKLGATITDDFKTFVKNTNTGVIILDLDQPLEVVKTLPGYSGCMLAKYNVYRFGFGSSAGNIQCERLGLNGSVIHFTTEALIESTSVSGTILKRYLMHKAMHSRTWKLYLQCAYLSLFQVLIERTKTHEKTSSKTVAWESLLLALKSIDQENKKNLQDPILLHPDTEDFLASDTATLTEFIRRTLRV